MDIQALIQQLQQIHQNQQQQSLGQPSMLSNIPNAPMPQQQQGGAAMQQGSPLDGIASGALSKLYTNSAAQATGLPWLAGGSAGNATSALLSLLMG